MNKYAKRFYDYVEQTEGYSCLSEYKGNIKHVLMKHEDCGTEYLQTPQKFLKGRRCHNCSPSKKLTKEKLQSDIDKLFPNKFKILSEYKNSHTKIRVLNCHCGHEYEIKQQDLKQGKDCFKCHGSKKYSQKEFELLFNDKKLKGYSLVGIYDGINKNVEIKHDVCGKVFNIVPSRYFRQFKKCPKCFTKSKGEDLIASFLDKLNISYEREYKFKDCKNKRELPFDFYLPDKNVCIEYQGIQHYKSVDIFGGNYNFEYTQHNDKIKKEYCENNNIELLEVPYFITDIKSFLVEKIC